MLPSFSLGHHGYNNNITIFPSQEFSHGNSNSFDEIFSDSSRWRTLPKNVSLKQDFGDFVDLSFSCSLLKENVCNGDDEWKPLDQMKRTESFGLLEYHSCDCNPSYKMLGEGVPTYRLWINLCPKITSQLYIFSNWDMNDFDTQWKRCILICGDPS